eukprot:199202-Hanusia_phi.AAC.9
MMQRGEEEVDAVLQELQFDPQALGHVTAQAGNGQLGMEDSCFLFLFLFVARLCLACQSDDCEYVH